MIYNDALVCQIHLHTIPILHAVINNISPGDKPHLPLGQMSKLVFEETLF